MHQTVIVLLSRQDPQFAQKKNKVQQAYPSASLEVWEDVKQLKDADLKSCIVVMDFDASNIAHIEAIELLESKAKQGVVFHLLADLDSRAISQISPQLRAKVENFIKKLIPLRESLPNKFLELPVLRLLRAGSQFCHQDEGDLYFFSLHPVPAEETIFHFELEISGKVVPLECTGTLTQVEPFDKDMAKKFYYQLRLDKASEQKLSVYFEALEKLNAEVEQWTGGQDE